MSKPRTLLDIVREQGPENINFFAVLMVGAVAKLLEKARTRPMKAGITRGPDGVWIGLFNGHPIVCIVIHGEKYARLPTTDEADWLRSQVSEEDWILYRGFLEMPEELAEAADEQMRRSIAQGAVEEPIRRKERI
ncbi:MAG: hypothetical protein K0U84_14085 [Actinomycetia bacterium]|nr:hypothetical protein [Actinomycetes bacterium]